MEISLRVLDLFSLPRIRISIIVLARPYVSSTQRTLLDQGPIFGPLSESPSIIPTIVSFDEFAVWKLLVFVHEAVF